MVVKCVSGRLAKDAIFKMKQLITFLKLVACDLIKIVL